MRREPLVEVHRKKDNKQVQAKMIDAVNFLKKHLIKKNNQPGSSCGLVSPESKELALKGGYMYLKDLSHMKTHFEQQYLLIFNEKLCYCKAKAYNRSVAVKWKEIRTSDITSLKICSDTLLSLKANTKVSSTKLLLRFHDQHERDEWTVAFNLAQSWSLVNDRTPNEVTHNQNTTVKQTCEAVNCSEQLK